MWKKPRKLCLEQTFQIYVVFCSNTKNKDAAKGVIMQSHLHAKENQILRDSFETEGEGEGYIRYEKNSIRDYTFAQSWILGPYFLGN